MFVPKITSKYQNFNPQNNNYKKTFCGRTSFYTITDMHQNADKHCKYVNTLIEIAKDNNNVVLLDNGDIFKGIYPKASLLNTYSRAKSISPNLEIIYNVGNNDPGYRDTDHEIFREYLKILNQAGIHVISANVIDERTGKIPEGIKPYVIINRDGDNLMYVGFVVNKIRQDFADMSTVDEADALTRIAPELKSKMKENNCKGLVMLVHDEENIALKLKQKAEELGLNPEFIIGGHVHHTYTDNENRIYYPEPFGLSMSHFYLDIDKDKHKLKMNTPVLPENCDLGIFDKEIKEVQKLEEYDKRIAKSVIELKHNYQPQYSMTHNELGTFYADAIKNITGCEIGLVPKSWIYDTLPKKNDGYITKMDILKSFPQPFSNIVKINLTPDELKKLIQNDIDKKHRIYESSQNMSFELNKFDNQIKQITINGKDLFDINGIALEPNRKIKIAIDYFSIRNRGYLTEETEYSMYDGIVNQLKMIEKAHNKGRYPVSNIKITD